LHVPVLSKEVIELLSPKQGAIVVDATLGSGGHTKALLECIGPQGRLIAVDQDKDAVSRARERLGEAPNVILHRSNYSEIDELLEVSGIDRIDAILFDLGVSREQLETPERGFSFLRKGLLDMRMNQSESKSAVDLVNELPEKELADIIWRYGEERRSRRIAKKICEVRKETPIHSTTDLASLIASCFPRGKNRIHPATRSFQGIRIAVNRELDHLIEALDKAIACLAPQGRIAVISYHSLEDRIVKRRFVRGREEAELKILTKRVVRPSDEEIAENSKARSAKLRVAEKVAA